MNPASRAARVFRFFALLSSAALARLAAQPELTLADAAVRLTFARGTDGWAVRELAATTPEGRVAVGTPSGRYLFLYAATRPDPKPVGPPLTNFFDPKGEARNRHIETTWAATTDAVSLNTAGEAQTFFPSEGARQADGSLTFHHQHALAELRADYALDREFPGDIRVTLTLTAKRPGFYSLATPMLAMVAPDSLAWATVPGYFQGAALEKNLLLTYGYGQGLPDKPVVLRERTASTLASIVSTKQGVTLAVTAEPGTAADPWEADKDTRANWKLGLSHLARTGEISPTLYHPVLAKIDSQLAAGESRTFRFRYTVRHADWFAVNQHIAEDIYRFSAALALREPRQSLTARLHQQHRYVTDDQVSLWRVEEFGGLRIGAQSYMGSVVGAKERGDSIKNSDYGAMWMLARLTEDPKLVRDRLPFARNFKLAQVQAEPGFFQGAAVGQYFLPSSKRFTEEWGPYVEPVALTYYALLDLGNILLFAPDDAEAKARFRLSAEKLLSWQRPDGSWTVAYDRKTQQPVYTDLTDLRPTFYGLLVAYRVLGDKKYLAAARRGGDWIIAHAVQPGKFLGVCGDVRFLPDFATAQIAQALLDLHAATGEARYRDAGVATARFYVTSVYTHPVASQAPRVAGGQPRAEWEINQAGLGFEHGGLMGSAAGAGPILLASHAGLFLRVHQLTGDPIFRDMARSAAVGREAFVDPATSVASYYWRSMNAGAGRFPHHAWWQIGWITDYLLSEIALRSHNAIAFPRGFFTPKVGPHASYGFAPGKIFGAAAELGWGEVAIDNPAIECVVARAPEGHRVYLMLLNTVGREQSTRLAPDLGSLTRGNGSRVTAARWLTTDTTATAAAGAVSTNAVAVSAYEVTLTGYGLKVLALDFAR